MSLAEIKRSITIGTRVTLTHHGAYGPGDTMPWAKGEITLPMARDVVHTQSNAVAFANPNDASGKSWLYWPKASEVSIHDDGTFTVGRMTYRIEAARADERGVIEVFDVDTYRKANPQSDVATCGTCERSWDDAVVTGWTPVPSARCPFEYDHEHED